MPRVFFSIYFTSS